jgi:putative chitinase
MSPQLLSDATGCGLLRASNYAPHIDAAMARWGVSTPLRRAAFLGQIAHESSALTQLEESLTYTAARLTQVWPTRFKSLSDAQPFANNPAALAEKVYGGRMGNDIPGDAFKYRGRGLKQVTGKENYLRYMMAAGADVIVNPDLLLQPQFAADSAGWFWSSNSCNALADARDWTGLTRRINGGTVGLSERFLRIARAMKALGVQ